jgi:hypothetical protein
MGITAILPDQVLTDGASVGDVLTAQADGTSAFQTPAAGGGIGGSTGSTDNAILRADSTGGSTLQGSPVTIADDGDIVINSRTEFDASAGVWGAGRVGSYESSFLAGEGGAGFRFAGGWGHLKAIGGIAETGAELSSAGGITLKTATGKGVHVGNGTDPKSVHVYNTYTSTTSYERLNIDWSEDVCTIQTVAGSAGGIKRGVKFGGASTDELGFFGATPVDQPATVSDPSGGSTVDTEARAAIAAVIDRLQELGLMA